MPIETAGPDTNGEPLPTARAKARRAGHRGISAPPTSGIAIKEKKKRYPWNNWPPRS